MGINQLNRIHAKNNTIFNWVDPKEKITKLLFLQQVPISHNDIFDEFKAMVYQALND